MQSLLAHICVPHTILYDSFTWAGKPHIGGLGNSELASMCKISRGHMALLEFSELCRFSRAGNPRTCSPYVLRLALLVGWLLYVCDKRDLYLSKENDICQKRPTKALMLSPSVHRLALLVGWLL